MWSRIFCSFNLPFIAFSAATHYASLTRSRNSSSFTKSTCRSSQYTWQWVEVCDTPKNPNTSGTFASGSHELLQRYLAREALIHKQRSISVLTLGAQLFRGWQWHTTTHFAWRWHETVTLANWASSAAQVCHQGSKSSEALRMGWQSRELKERIHLLALAYKDIPENGRPFGWL